MRFDFLGPTFSPLLNPTGACPQGFPPGPQRVGCQRAATVRIPIKLPGACQTSSDADAPFLTLPFSTLKYYVFELNT